MCDTVRFIPHTIPIPKTNIDDFLRQAASDIIHILSRPPSTTAPSLNAGDPVRNALVEISKQLGRADTIHIEPPIIQSDTLKVQDIPLPPRVTAPPPRVTPPLHQPKLHRLLNKELGLRVTVNALEPRSGKLMNSRFRNTVNYRYPLRSL